MHPELDGRTLDIVYSLNDHRKKVVELERFLKESNSIVKKLEAEVGEIKAPAVMLPLNCMKQIPNLVLDQL